MGNNLQEIKQETIDLAEKRINEMQQTGELDLPENYSVGNALRSAWLKLQETKDKNKTPVLENCSRISIINSLLQTVVLGLSPARDQVYYIPYGKTLTAQPSYFGKMAIARRLDDIEDIRAEVIYGNDEVGIEIKNGNKTIAKHETDFASIDNNNIAGAYCVISFKDDRPDRYTIMTMAEIKKAWDMGRGEQKPHKDFAQQMAKKTVIGRACTEIINSSNDSYLMDRAMGASADESVRQEVEGEIEENANTETIDITPEGETDPADAVPDSEPEEEPPPEKDDPFS